MTAGREGEENRKKGRRKKGREGERLFVGIFL